MTKKIILLALAVNLASATTSQAQLKLDKVFDHIFDQVLNKDLILSPQDHAGHYLDAAAEANNALTPALKHHASNVSVHFLPDTAGLLSDWSTATCEHNRRLGPIFTETAETLGKVDNAGSITPI
jgi:hypothetical protein